jgi:hypothetical protein
MQNIRKQRSLAFASDLHINALAPFAIVCGGASLIREPAP